MIKNIYDKYNKQYRHEYFCDNCFAEITYVRVYRNEGLMKSSKIDLCYKCFKYPVKYFFFFFSHYFLL